MSHPLLKILCLAFCLRFLFLLAIPVGNQESNFGIVGFNDELSHFHFVRYLAEYRAFPVQKQSVQDLGAFEKNEFEYYQAPAYYLISVPFYLAFEKVKQGSGLYGIRCLSLLLGVLTVAAVYWAGKAFDKGVGKISALVLSLFPTHAYYTALVTNDSLTWLMSVLWIGVILHALNNRDSRLGLKAGGIIALSLLTKSSLLCQLPLALMLSVHRFQSGRKIGTLVADLAVGCLALALASPYYYRNWTLYGSFLALDTGAGPPTGYLIHFSWPRLYEFLAWTTMTFWNPINISFGFNNLAVKLVLFVLTVICLGLLVFGLIAYRSQNGNMDKKYITLWLSLGLAWAGYVNYNLQYQESDARLMFPALLPLTILFVLSGRYPRLTTDFDRCPGRKYPHPFS